jgi:hypothetical protein
VSLLASILVIAAVTFSSIASPALALTREKAIEKCKQQVGIPNFRACMHAGGNPKSCKSRTAPKVKACVRAALNAAPAGASVSFIDVHTHLFGGAHNDSFKGAVDAAIREMDRFKVRKSIVMSPPRGPGVASNFDYPQFLDLIRRHADRFAFLGGGGALNPILHGVDASAVTPEVAARFKETALDILKAGASGFGEMSSLHLSLVPSHGYNFVPADHPLLLLLADIAAEHDVPIDLHMDALGTAEPTPRRLAGNQNPVTLPATIGPFRRLLEHNPKAKIVWAHVGSDHLGKLTPRLVGELLDRYPNLYVSLRVVPPAAPVMNKLFRPGRIEPAWASVFSRHPSRFVIGTDSFYLAANAQGGRAIKALSRGDEPRLRATGVFLNLLPPALSRKFANENAMRIYKLGRE